MFETDAERAELQSLLDRSIAGAGAHLRSIVEPGRRTLTATGLIERTRGVCVLNLATTTGNGQPRLSAVDGHLVHGRWYFTTAGSAVKARHLRARPAVSVAFTPRDGLGVWAHGQAVFLDPAAAETREAAEFRDLEAYLVLVYGESPTEWGDDIVYLRVDPDWMVGFSMTEEETEHMQEVVRARDERLAIYLNDGGG